MTLSRGLKQGGRTIAVLGVVLLLFVAYQLWGTSLQYARAQSELRDDFSDLLSQTAAFRDGAAGTGGLSSSRDAVASSGNPGGIAILSSGAPASGTSNGIASLSSSTATLSDGTATLSAGTATPSGLAYESSTLEAQPPEALPATSSNTETPQDAAVSRPSPSPASASPSETTRETLIVSPSTRLPREDIENADLVYTPGSEEILPLLYPGNGEAVARIVIPAIKMDEIVVEGTDVDALRKGPGHYPWTPMPGQPGNASIAGHRTTYGAPFANIGSLRPGDRITVQTAQGEFVYEVLAQDSPTKGYLIVSPDRVDLLRDKGNNLLTLTSCHPRFSNRQRIVVQAKLLGDPVVPMRDVNARQDAPMQLASEDLTGVTDAEGSAASENNALQTATAAETARIGEAGVGEAGATDRATPANAASGETGATGNASSSGLASTQQAGSAAEPEGSEISGAAGASQNALSASSGSAGSVGSSAAGSASQSAAGTSFGSGLSGERSAIPSAALWFAATGILWGAVWLVGTRWRRLPSTAIGILPVLGCLFVAFSYLDRALPSY